MYEYLFLISVKWAVGLCEWLKWMWSGYSQVGSAPHVIEVFSFTYRNFASWAVLPTIPMQWNHLVCWKTAEERILVKSTTRQQPESRPGRHVGKSQVNKTTRRHVLDGKDAQQEKQFKVEGTFTSQNVALKAGVWMVLETAAPLLPPAVRICNCSW